MRNGTLLYIYIFTMSQPGGIGIFESISKAMYLIIDLESGRMRLKSNDKLLQNL